MEWIRSGGGSILFKMAVFIDFGVKTMRRLRVTGM